MNKKLQEQAKEIKKLAEESGVQSNFLFITTFERYLVQLGILEQLEKYCTFATDLCSNNFYEDIVAPLEAAGCFNNWTYDSGATKGVLIFGDENFVIKIPFCGYVDDEAGHWEDSRGNYRHSYETGASTKINNEDWSWNYDWAFYDFEGASAEKNNWDYCAAEEEFYHMAEDSGVNLAFAKTEFLGFCGDHPIYIQERCSMFYEESSSKEYNKRTEKDYETVSALRDALRFHEFNDDWALDFLIYWGEAYFKKLAEFIKDACIYDLHNGNIGYRNGAPVLVDYSSFER
jgi:hypothetical protein